MTFHNCKRLNPSKVSDRFPQLIVLMHNPLSDTYGINYAKNIHEVDKANRTARGDDLLHPPVDSLLHSVRHDRRAAK